MRKLIFLLLIPSLGWGAMPCETPELLQKIRPGAIWIVRDQTIEWLDAVQVQPTALELQTAKTDCLATLTPAGILAGQRAAAITQLNIDPSGNAKVIRAVFLVTLDEVNLIRSLLVPAQPARTMTQFRTAVQNKINSGAAD